ncbi:FtsB family cell division protein [Candidatus Viridilinea mediisalina]|uniref:Septum formation initiator n=1 Tax=Candidatus Viridilinea mediisalina TaxID=2024553 RepID=A0A2A6RNW4_9CHLR|nr:septum formation initiator family protein [Candidatus Viridilinea mediisalina]PDW04794.1 hypothetical protein CJ255_01760 [Candidatus Viridilinea mediisalina]
MKRLRSHASRRLIGLGPRRRAASSALPLADRLIAGLRAVGSNAFSLGIAALMLVFIGLLMVNFVGQVLQSARLETRRAELEAEVLTIRYENERLAGLVEYTESPVYAEMVARGQLGYAREGDVVILSRTEPLSIPEIAAPDEALDPSVVVPQQPENWRLWWQALRGG